MSTPVAVSCKSSGLIMIVLGNGMLNSNNFFIKILKLIDIVSWKIKTIALKLNKFNNSYNLLEITINMIIFKNTFLLLKS